MTSSEGDPTPIDIPTSSPRPRRPRGDRSRPATGTDMLSCYGAPRFFYSRLIDPGRGRPSWPRTRQPRLGCRPRPIDRPGDFSGLILPCDTEKSLHCPRLSWRVPRRYLPCSRPFSSPRYKRGGARGEERRKRGTVIADTGSRFFPPSVLLSRELVSRYSPEKTASE